MPRVPDEDPHLATGSEQAAWAALCEQAGPDDPVLPDVRVTPHGEDREVDLLVVCGDPDHVRAVAGEATLRKLRGHA